MKIFGLTAVIVSVSPSLSVSFASKSPVWSPWSLLKLLSADIAYELENGADEYPSLALAPLTAVTT